MASPQERKSPAITTTKKPGKKSTSPQCPPTLQEVKKRGQRMRKTPERDICDQLDGLHLDRDSPAVGTGLVYDDRMTLPYCLWDDKFPECPARILAIKEKLAQYGLVDRCVKVPAREASDADLLLVHSSDFVELMKSTQEMNQEKLKELSDRYDSVFLHPASFTTSCLAVGSVLQLVDKVVKGEIRNGLALVRPPGHHAHTDKMNGYCMFNHLAIGAKYAQHNHGVKRVLIVDWDVHHGHGTQFIFEHDPSVLYFSIHRYENGEFWPHLAESSSSAVGKERGERYNINVPWNKIAMKDADYITAFLHLLLPVAYEFQPHLVLVAAGYDSVVGDPKGEMAATPACFAHLTHLLMSLAEGRLILSLEGGYNLRSASEAVCASLKILLGDPCPSLPQPFAPCESGLESISDTFCVLRKFWRSLQEQDFTLTQEVKAQEISQTALEDTSEDTLTVVLDASMKEVMRKLPQQRTGLVYDERMMEHYNMWDSGHPETPQRIARIYLRHKEMGLLDRCIRLCQRVATKDQLQMCHSLPYIEKIEKCSRMKPRDLHRMGDEYNSIFINNKSYSSACLAAGSTFSVVEAVLKGKVQNGVCIVRPPGHHAEPGAACGFCFFNNVALAAQYAQSLKNPSEPRLRVMILDWDIHHGNGTQHIFQEDDSVLYVSIHRYDDGQFFPASEDAAHDRVGVGRGEGFNVNIAWNGGKMGDAEYLLAFHRIVMPIAYEFNPQLVLISAGFDAARGDPLGGCRVSPEGYAHMTHLLMGLAGGKVVIVLEGGYNLISISDSMSMCTRTLLGDPPPHLTDLHPPRPSALRAISNVLSVHNKYWRSLRLQVNPSPPSEVSKEVCWTPQKQQPSKVMPMVESSSSPQLTTISPGKNIVETQCLQEFYLTGFKADDDSLNTRSEILEVKSQLSVAFRNESNDSVSSIDSHSVTYTTEESMETPSSENGQTLDSVGEPSPQKSTEMAKHELKESSVNKDEVSNSLLSNLADVEKKEELVVEVQIPGQDSVHIGSNEGESLGTAIEVQVLERTPDILMSDDRTESSVEELLRDLKLDNSKNTTPSITDNDSEPSGGARKKIFPLVQQVANSSEETSSQDTHLEENLLSEAAGKCSASCHQLDVESSLKYSGEIFTVTPLASCPHLESVCELPPCGLNVTQLCAACGTDIENWVCLTCYVVLCGRYVSQHMMSHGVSSGHNLVLSFSDLSVWCYGCDSYIHNEVLIPAKQSAYYSRGQNSVHLGSNKSKSLGTVIEVQVLERAPDILMSDDRRESSVNELLRDVKLEDSKNTSTTSISDGDREPAGEARKKIFPVVQQVADSSVETSSQDTHLEENLLSEAAGGCSASYHQLDVKSSLEYSGEMFTVTPLSWCPHLESVCELPPCGLEVTQPCAACGTDIENWVCLTCYVVLCGRYVSQHMMSHGVSSGHNLVLSFSDLSVWCYGCDSYIHNEVLIPAKQSAYYSKFGEEMPGA
ncbi:histone deacetylase 6 isoform X1 [Aquarana catesbeiana]|uniref:histone deacetylase 6 isoform X1 n=1 Tax=Aquarana catesbeiana TaxID=8400 RepID=UPI003CC98590